ncbi:MAG: hypothetical protein M3360_06515 [Actinomycetota bacterium]|nr:hypothetical protein [Actinomycetota bacterium]
MRSAEIVGVASAKLSHRVVQASVHWTLRDDSGDDICSFHALYTLIEAGQELRITAIAHDEMPHIQEAVSDARK